MFYQSIAQVYDYIFPQNALQLSFIDGILSINPNDRILDIGCATGNLTELLSRKTPHIIGLDLDHELLTYAETKHPSLQFVHENMLKIHERYGKDAFTAIVSFGNTLVHLPSREDVITYFEAVYNCLVSGGTFVTQIINYDRIMNQKIKALPTVENEHITFIRDYVLHDGYVDFVTELTIHDNDQTIKNSIPLLALTQSEIQMMLEKVGFKQVTFYGNLKGKSLEDHDIPLIFSCHKEG